MVLNYQFVFEVNELDEITDLVAENEESDDFGVEILPPDEYAVEVGIIDSGIMENHKFLEPAINHDRSSSYVKDGSSADLVQGGGHGTKVAGAVLYPQGISDLKSPYKLPCFIRNLRILNENNTLDSQFPAEIMKHIVTNNGECSVFNLSINSNAECRTKHMSTWAAVIDNLIYKNDVLFVISSGNITFQAIQTLLTSGIDYPSYLEQNQCRIANPAQSCFSLTVGSVNHGNFEDDYWRCLGDKNEVSAYSRIGVGIWNIIKPDVVEYGGGVILSKNGTMSIRTHENTSPELVRSTYHGGSAIGKDSVGTSFSTPKVTSQAAILRQLYPKEDINLIRAFIAQGARLPNQFFRNPTKMSIQHFGYGIPLLDRVTSNNEFRISFYNVGKLKAEEGQLYSLKIPEEVRNPGEEFDVLIEVTLAYTAQVRRTRQKTKSYLSTWLDWTTSKIGESYEEFVEFALREEGEDEVPYDRDYRSSLSTFPWKIRNRVDTGDVVGLSRSNSTLQKDWAIVKSYDIPEEITFAIRGHRGWDRNKREIPYAIVVSLEMLGSEIPIYNSIKIENEIELEVEVKTS